MNDYMMDRATEHPAAMKFFEKVADGDTNVLSFLWSVWNFSQAFDDLVNGKVATAGEKEQVVKALHDYTFDLMLNPFVLAHRQELHAMLTSMMTRYLDGEEMRARKDPNAAVVRCGDVDLAMHVAYLHRGWAFLRSLKDDRKYDKE